MLYQQSSRHHTVHQFDSTLAGSTSCSDAGYISGGTPRLSSSPGEFTFDLGPTHSEIEMNFNAFDAFRFKQGTDSCNVNSAGVSNRRRSLATIPSTKSVQATLTLPAFNTSNSPSKPRPNSANSVLEQGNSFSIHQQQISMQNNSSACCFLPETPSMDALSCMQLCNDVSSSNYSPGPQYEKFPSAHKFYSGNEIKPEFTRRQHSDNIVEDVIRHESNVPISLQTSHQNCEFSNSYGGIDLRSKSEELGFIDTYNIVNVQNRSGHISGSERVSNFKLSSTPDLSTSCDFVPFVSSQKSCQFQTQSRPGDMGGLSVLPHYSGLHGPKEESRENPAINPLYTSEDEAWRSYLENPLTAASTAMMSIHGDEDSAAALGILYDYYKVPREKRILAYQPSNKEKQNCRYISSQDGEVTSSTFVRKDISGISPLSTTSINPQSENVNSEINVRDHTPDELTSPHLKNFPHSDVITLSTVRPELSALCEVNGLGEYLNIGRTQDIKQLTPDSTYSEAKESPPQITQIYNDYTSKYIKQHSKVSTYPVSPKNYNNCTTPLTTTPTGSQPFGSPSSVATLPSMFSPPSENFPSDYAGEYFEYAMEAPKSLKQKDGEPTMSYINKGQFYCISLRECSGRPWRYQNSRVTSVVQIVFGDGKPEEEQLSHWKYWHARQHTAKQRIIDIADYKESCMISDIDEFAHNAISFSWDVNDVAKIFVSCNCLSTDFSAQKGIKGLPLLLQIDTYIDNRRGVAPAHRGMCQLKVFCDKGAERKIRDEERKAIRKRQRSAVAKGSTSSSFNQSISTCSLDQQAPLRSPSITPPPATGAPGGTPGKRLDVVYFRTVFDYITPSVYFVPEVYSHTNNIRITSAFSPHVKYTDAPSTSTDPEYPNTHQVDSVEPFRSGSKRLQSILSSDEGELPPSKMPKLSNNDDRVLLYVRKENDEVYDGIMLRESTVKGLKQAIEEKYGIPVQNISKVLKKSRKGILVNIDDNIVRHYSNEDTFIINVETETLGNDVTHKITLSIV